MNGNVKVLIVEDENIIALDIKRTLQKLGYDITSIVSTAVDAIQKVETEKPDVILMDIQLDSKLDGIEATKIISHKYNTPIIYVTAFEDEQTIKRIKASHPFDFIIKPFDGFILNQKIQSAVKKSQAIQN